MRSVPTARPTSTLQSAQRRSQALARAAELTRVRYDGGESSRLDVINADRLALTAQAQSADAARALTEAQANVFRALGGGSGFLRRTEPQSHRTSHQSLVAATLVHRA